MSPNEPFKLGCPAWSVANWRGSFLAKDAKQSDFLNLYSRVFNTVEGNSTFYGLPKPETAQRWAEQVMPGFEFCFKVPRDISHGGGLMVERRKLTAFCEFLAIFAEAGVLGPTFLQLHDSFGPTRMPELRQFCEEWSADFPLAVEVRHKDFFAEGDEEKRLNDYLKANSHDRVIFDSRALYHAPADDSIEAISQTRKPNLPVSWGRVTAQRPFLRMVGRNQIAKSEPWVKEAAANVATWIKAGLRPYVFMHTPDDAFAPMMGEMFHRYLRMEMPIIPELDMTAALGGQMELF